MPKRKIKSVHRTLRVPVDLDRAMRALARRDNLTFAEQVIPLLRATYAPASAADAPVALYMKP